VLDAIGDPGNAGTLLRSAAAAGVTRVLATTGTVDCYAPKVVRAGAGAHFCLPLLADCSWELVRQTLPAPCQVLLADARAATAYWDVDWTRPSALIVSNEAHGASAAARALAAAAIAIPMRRTESLNVAVAGSIILFEALRQRAGRWPVASGQWPAGHAPR
jgi:TrmH family RNA methyltransferase